MRRVAAIQVGTQVDLHHRDQHAGHEDLVGGEIHEHAERRDLVPGACDPAVEDVAEGGDDEEDGRGEVGPGTGRQQEHHDRGRGQDAAETEQVRERRDRARTCPLGHQLSPSLRSVPARRRPMLSAWAITTTSAMSAAATTASIPTQSIA